jgi:hypothetical protein
MDCDAKAAAGAEGAAGACSSSSMPPWQLMPGVSLQALLAFLAACLQPGMYADREAHCDVWLLAAAASSCHHKFHRPPRVREVATASHQAGPEHSRRLLSHVLGAKGNTALASIA